jgi:tetratricopeptide (TPR) repeat protein
LQHSLAFDPDNREVLLDTAEVYRQLERPKRALATLAVLEETYGPNQVPAEVLALEGLAQESLGRRHDALESYRAAVAKGDAPPQAAARLAALEAEAPTTFLR